jgi:hypothetical protein
MALNKNALIDTTYYFQMANNEEMLEDERMKNMIEAMINAVSQQFEIFCNRILVERTFTYDDTDTTNYDANLLHYAIFDAPRLATFYFPTYPVSTITKFEISGTEISAAEADDYDASEGYILYSRRGKLIYSDGFDYPYLQNVKAIWKGGYGDNHPELSDLRYLCYMAIKNYVNAPENSMMESERMGNYAYKLMSPYFQKSLVGYSPQIFENLMKYRKVAFA